MGGQGRVKFITVNEIGPLDSEISCRTREEETDYSWRSQEFELIRLEI